MIDHNAYQQLEKLRLAAGEMLRPAMRLLIPLVAGDFRSASADGENLRVASLMHEVAQTLESELAHRCERAVAVLDDLQFKVLRQSAPDAHRVLQAAVARTDDGAAAQRADRNAEQVEQDWGRFELLSDTDLSEQLLALRVARKLGEQNGKRVQSLLARLSVLNGLPPDDELQPMGARAISLALVSGFRPWSGNERVVDHLSAFLVQRAVPALAEIVGLLNDRLDQWGVIAAPETVDEEVDAGPRSDETPSAIGPVLVDSPDNGTRSGQTGDSGASGDSDDSSIEITLPMPGRGAGTPVFAADAADFGGVKDAMEDVLDGLRDVRGPDVSQYASRAHAHDWQSGAGGDARNLASLSLGGAEIARSLRTNELLSLRDERTQFRDAARIPKLVRLDREQATVFADRRDLAPYSPAARRAFLRDFRERMVAASASPAQLLAVDLVIGVFEEVARDDRIPQGTNELLWRLQQPALTLASLDPGYLGDDKRSMRQLVQRIVSICIAFPADVVAGTHLYGSLHAVVREVELIAHAFQVRSLVLSNQVDREYSRAANGVHALIDRVQQQHSDMDQVGGRRNRRDFRNRPSRELESEVTRRLSGLVRERSDRNALPESVETFLNDVWLRHMRTAVLRDGEESSEYRDALGAMDGLLWSIDASLDLQANKRIELAQRIPVVLRSLNRGIESVGARPDDYAGFFSDIFSLHMERLHPRRSGVHVQERIADELTMLVAHPQMPRPVAQAAAKTGARASEDLRSAAGSASLDAATETPSVQADGGAHPQAESGAEHGHGRAGALEAHASSPHPSDSHASESKVSAPRAPAREASRSPFLIGAVRKARSRWFGREATSDRRRTSIDDEGLTLIDQDAGIPRPGADASLRDRTVSGPSSNPDGGRPLTGRDEVTAPMSGPVVEHWSNRKPTEGIEVTEVDPAELAELLKRLGPQGGVVDALPAPDFGASDHAQDYLQVHARMVAHDGPAPAGQDAGLNEWLDRQSSRDDLVPAPQAFGSGDEFSGGVDAHAQDQASSPAAAVDASFRTAGLSLIVEQTTLDDAPVAPQRVPLSPLQLANSLEPGQWLEFISSDGSRSLVKVAWMNDRRSVALLLQHPDRTVLSRQVSAMYERARMGRLWRVR